MLPASRAADSVPAVDGMSGRPPGQPNRAARLNSTDDQVLAGLTSDGA
jgi:hypothetical protein